ncbi:hypothetical protein ACHAXS_001264 [Conticribra weissflogii]
MKTGVDMIQALRYKLRMIGVAIYGPMQIYRDNMSIIMDTSKPESTLNKESNAVYYHTLRESVTMRETLWHTYVVKKTQQT